MCESECRACKGRFPKIKKRVLETGRIYYADAKGRRWNGLACPDCYHRETKESRARNGGAPKRKSRSYRVVDDEFAPKPPKLRSCGDCGVMSVNYFKCPPCTSLVSNSGCVDEVGFAEMQGGREGRSVAGWAY